MLTVSEPLSAVTGATLDGGPTTAPALSGANATFATGPLADGPHTLAGTLVDLVGKAADFTTHFTIVSGAAPADWPYVEINAFPWLTTTLDSPDGGAAVIMRGAPSSPTDHLVLRIDPNPSTGSGSLVYGVTAYWSLTGVQVHAFASPVEIELTSPTGDPSLVPATLESGVWRPIPIVPTPGSLPSGWSDGYFLDAGRVHILTMHLSDFTLLHDSFPPPPVRDVSGVVAVDGLTLRWAPGIDPTGPIAQVQLAVDGAWDASFDPTQYETKLGPIAAGDPRTFVFTETDPAGNVSAPSVALRALPALAGRTLADTTSALAASGFSLGTVTSCPIRRPGRHRRRARGRPGPAPRLADRRHRLHGAGDRRAAAPFKLRALTPTFRTEAGPHDRRDGRGHRPRRRRRSRCSTLADTGSHRGAGSFAPASTGPNCDSPRRRAQRSSTVPARTGCRGRAGRRRRVECRATASAFASSSLSPTRPGAGRLLPSTASVASARVAA